MVRIPDNAPTATGIPSATVAAAVHAAPATEEAEPHVGVAPITPYGIRPVARPPTVAIPTAGTTEARAERDAPVPVLEAEVRPLLITDTVPTPVPDTEGFAPPVRAIPERSRAFQDPIMADGVHAASGAHLARPVTDAFSAATQTVAAVTIPVTTARPCREARRSSTPGRTSRVAPLAPVEDGAKDRPVVAPAIPYGPRLPRPPIRVARPDGLEVAPARPRDGPSPRHELVSATGARPFL